MELRARVEPLLTCVQPPLIDASHFDTWVSSRSEV